MAAIVISPKTPPAGSGLERPNFAPKTTFAYRDPGSPSLPSIIFLIGSSVSCSWSTCCCSAVVERRRPLGVALTPAHEPERQPAGAGARPA